MLSDFEVISGQKIYYTSSESMREVDNDSIDVIVTSPPYNRNKIYSDDKGNVYDDDQAIDEYESLLRKVWSECFRVLAPHGLFFLNIGDSAKNQGFSEYVCQFALKSGFKRLQTIIWVKSILGKGHYTPSGRDRRLNNIFEYIFLLVKDRKKYRINPKAEGIGIPYADKSNIGRYGKSDLRDAGNVWFIPYSRTTGATIKKGHEAPFPIELPYRCIKLAGAKNVLDPFMGTGTTLTAARILGIKGIGYEKYPRKDVIRERINLHQFSPQPTVLLPHLELTVRKYVSLFEGTSFQELLQKKAFTFTKAEYKEIKIVYDVLAGLNQNSSLLVDYLIYYEQHFGSDSSSDRRTRLTSFLEK